MDELTLAVVALGSFGTLFGLVALWQARLAQTRIAGLRAAEDRLRTLTPQPAAVKPASAAKSSIMTMDSTAQLSFAVPFVPITPPQPAPKRMSRYRGLAEKPLKKN